METRHHVVAAILELDELYRSVVLLRYEQNLSPQGIGKRLGRSEATVRSRLSRAHVRLRERLDREFGDRRQWAALALPIVGKPDGAVARGRAHRDLAVRPPSLHGYGALGDQDKDHGGEPTRCDGQVGGPGEHRD
jgi:hypothetical protein